jgi:hypothetical protein
LGYRLIFIYPDNNPTLVPGMWLAALAGGHRPSHLEQTQQHYEGVGWPNIPMKDRCVPDEMQLFKNSNWYVP